MENVDFEFDSDCTIEDFCTIARHLGFDVSASDVAYSGFCRQGDGVSFSGQFCLSGYGAGPVSDYAPNDAEYLKIEQKIKRAKLALFRQLCGLIPLECMSEIRAMFTKRTACAYVVIDRRNSRYAHEMTMNSDDGQNIAEDIAYRLGDSWEDVDQLAIESACESFAESILEEARSMAQSLYFAIEEEFDYQQIQATGWHLASLIEDKTRDVLEYFPSRDNPRVREDIRDIIRDIRAFKKEMAECVAAGYVA